MSRRRTLLRGLAALTTGSVLGFFGSATAATPTPTTLYNPTHSDSAKTVVTARINPTIRDEAGVPEPIAPLWDDLTAQYPSINAGTFEPISANLYLNGETVLSGCAIASGEYDTDSFQRELRNQQARAFGAGAGWTDRFVFPNSRYAVGITGTTLAVSYGQTSEEALSYVDATDQNDYGTHRGNSVAPAALEGDAVSYAKLGSRTRSRLLERIDDSRTDLKAVLRNTDSAGVALTVGSSQSRIEYGFITDPTSVSVNDVSAAARRIVGDDGSLGVESITREGQMIVVEVTAETATLWDVQEQLLGAVSR